MTVSQLPAPSGGHTAYGITVYTLGEDGDAMVAFGHHDHRRFLAACNHYARFLSWENLADDRAVTWAEMREEIHQEHGAYADTPEEVAEITGEDCDWAITWGHIAGPGTVPITMWRA